MAENPEIKDTEFDEKPPGQKKHAKIYVAICLIVLIVALIADTFRRVGDEKKQVSESQRYEGVDQQQGKNIADFERRLNEEQERRKIKNQFPDVKEKPEDTMARLKKDQQLKEQGFQLPLTEASNKVDISKEFHDSEKRRALNARKSRFNLKKKSAATGIQPAVHKSTMVLPVARNLNAIAAEKKRVMQEIQRLNGMQGLSPIQPAISPVSANDTAYNNTMQQLTVGQPASKGGPEPGQKLIPTATVINAALDQNLMSDYAGSYRGMITHDVYDVSRNSIIIPKGSRFIGDCFRISNVNEPIQARMGLTVKWVILPNGKRIDLKKIGNMLDREGIHAVEDKVNHHFIAQFLGVAAYALISTETSTQGTGIANDVTYEGQVGQSMREQFAPVAAKYLELVPTITLSSGTPIKIFLEDDVYAHEWSSLRRRLLNANRTSY